MHNSIPAQKAEKFAKRLRDDLLG